MTIVNSSEFAEARPVQGWPLSLTMRIDTIAPGYLRYVCGASALKRQASFLTLAVLRDKGLEHVFSCFRKVGVAEDRTGTDPLAHIARALTVLRARDICRALVEDGASILVSLLSRASHDALPQHIYRHLIDLSCSPDHKERAALLRGRDKITANIVEVALR